MIALVGAGEEAVPFIRFKVSQEMQKVGQSVIYTVTYRLRSLMYQRVLTEGLGDST